MQVKVSSYDRKVENYSWGGKTRTLVCDGALDHDVWDRLSASTPPDSHDQFIKTLHDARLLSQGTATAETLGSQWEAADEKGRVFVLGQGEGPRQELHFGPAGRSGGDFTVKTILPGDLEHQMKGRSTFGELNTDAIEEMILLP